MSMSIHRAESGRHSHSNASDRLRRGTTGDVASRHIIRRYCRRLLTSKEPRSALDRELLQHAAKHLKENKQDPNGSLKDAIDYVTERFCEALIARIPNASKSEHQRQTRLAVETAIYPPKSSVSARTV
jgi:hypothetical protein